MDKKYYSVTATQKIHKTWRRHVNQFNKIDALEAYIPTYAHSFITTSQHDIEKYISEGKITPDFNLVNPFRYTHFVQIGTQKFLINMNVTGANQVVDGLEMTMHVEYDAHTRSHTPLLDAIVLTGRALEVAPEQTLFYIELDAYLHQEFERCQHMFNYLFSNLRRFHEERYSEIYKQCLRHQ